MREQYLFSRCAHDAIKKSPGIQMLYELQYLLGAKWKAYIGIETKTLHAGC